MTVRSPYPGSTGGRRLRTEDGSRSIVVGLMRRPLAALQVALLLEDVLSPAAVAV
jgi:hypothetical protein